MGWNMGVKSQSLASYINRIYLFIRVRICNSCVWSDCSADFAEKVVYFYTKIRNFAIEIRRISSRGERNSFIRLSYLPGRIISLLSIRGSRCCIQNVGNIVISVSSQHPFPDRINRYLILQKEERKKERGRKKLDENSWSGNDLAS